MMRARELAGALHEILAREPQMMPGDIREAAALLIAQARRIEKLVTACDDLTFDRTDPSFWARYEAFSDALRAAKE